MRFQLQHIIYHSTYWKRKPRQKETKMSECVHGSRVLLDQYKTNSHTHTSTNRRNEKKTKKKWFSSSPMKYFTPKNVLSIISIWPRHAQNCLMIISSVPFVFFFLHCCPMVFSSFHRVCVGIWGTIIIWTDALAHTHTHAYSHNTRSNHSFSSFILLLLLLVVWAVVGWSRFWGSSSSIISCLPSVQINRNSLSFSWGMNETGDTRTLCYCSCPWWLYAVNLFGIHLNLPLLL